MKKLISFTTAAIALSTGIISAFPTFAAEENHDYDFNKDGVVDSADLHAVMIYMGNNAEYEITYDEHGIPLSIEEKKGTISEEVLETIKSQGIRKPEKDVDGEPSPFYAEISNEIYKGGALSADINGDGFINPADAELTLKFYADVQEKDYKSLTDKERLDVIKNGDITGDGTINALDSSFILSYVLSLYTAGDANLDGSLNATDASDVLRFYAEKQSKLETTKQLYAETSDMNHDGEINAVDASMILSAYAKEQTK